MKILYPFRIPFLQSAGISGQEIRKECSDGTSYAILDGSMSQGTEGQVIDEKMLLFQTIYLGYWTFNKISTVLV